MTGYSLQPFMRIVDVHFSSSFAWYAVITAGNLNNIGGAGFDIYEGAHLSPYYQSTGDDRAYNGYVDTTNEVVSTGLLTGDPGAVIYLEHAFGTVSQQPISVDPTHTDSAINDKLAAMRVNSFYSNRTISGPSTIDQYDITFRDDLTLSVPDPTLFDGKFIHIRLGNDPTDDPSTDLASSHLPLSSITYFTGDGVFNRGFYHYFNPGFPIASVALFTAGTQYTVLINDTPGTV